ncbi:ABC transporter permease [Actinophytocola sp.]|uniref:ABC transporter permease n=1 Tax=Actinophytocola sp. TaxID=1872138 RepID=UPI002D7FCB02|nr:ABC transporter permease [Actinophytocola sp.]HET9140308.1 ABC transporter permease [Actinophytocola sp.]
MSFGYLLLEVRRGLRSIRFLIFTVAMPVALFLLYTGIFASDQPGYTAVLMVNMTGYGALTAAMFAGGRIALERAAGWQRQLRLTPLSGAGYLTAKGVTAMVLALPGVLLVPLVAVLFEGVSLDAGQWSRVVLGSWLAVIPFAVLGLLLGQIGTAESMQPLMSVVMMVMALLGGIFIPIDGMPAGLLTVARLLPSYWLQQVGRGAVTSELSVSLGNAALVLAAWTVVLGLAVARRYRRDSARV